MTVATPEKPRFDPAADYRNTLASFELAFAQGAREGAAFDAGQGVRVLAGNMVATESLTYIKGAETLHLVVVEVVGEERTSYRYQLQHVNGNGESFGQNYTGMYLSNFGDTELKNHTQREGERARDWLDAARFDLFEAMAAAPDQVSTPIVDVIFAEEGTVDKAKSATRRIRAARWLGWLGPLNPLRPKDT